MPEPQVTVHPAPRVGRLDTLRAVRREAGRLYRDARQGRVAPGDASKLASVLALIGTLIRDHDLEERIAALEAPHAP